MSIADIKPGTFVEWTVAGGDIARVEVISIDRDGVIVRSSDGHTDYHPTSAYVSLDDIVRRWRLAR